MSRVRQIRKTWVAKLQRQKAELDVMLGYMPQKSSKTYLTAYAHFYAEKEGLSHQHWTSF